MKFIPNFVYLNETKKIYERLLEKAKEDGIVSGDEQAILDTVQAHLEEYEEKLKKALSDGLLTQEEIHHLRKARESIQEEVWEVADNDIRISAEEKNLISLLITLLGVLYP